MGVSVGNCEGSGGSGGSAACGLGATADAKGGVSVAPGDTVASTSRRIGNASSGMGAERPNGAESGAGVRADGTGSGLPERVDARP